MVEIGIDIIDIDRIARILKKYPKFRSRVFTEKEISYCEKKKYPAQHYAVRFAAKESIMKALGTGWAENIHWKDLEIRETSSGKPKVYLHGQAQVICKKQRIKEIKVSLSHCKAYGVALAQVVKG